MSCNRIVTFENLIQVPNSIDFIIPINQQDFYVVANTDKLNTEYFYGKFPAGTIDNICPANAVTVDVNLYEIRVSGYLTYSVSIQCLKSSPNVTLNNMGFISTNAVLPITTIEPGGNNLPYMVVEYKGEKPSTFNIIVSLVDIRIDEIKDINGNKFLVIKGSFEIQNN